MKFLILSLDPKIHDAASQGYQRQKLHFAHDEALVLQLTVGSAIVKEDGNLRLRRISSRSKVEMLFRFFCWSIRTKEKFDVILSQDVTSTGLLGWLFSAYHGTPHLTQLHGDYIDNPLWLGQRLVNRPLNFLAKRVLKNAAGVRAVSMRIENEMTKKGYVAKEKIASIPIGTDTGFYKKGAEQGKERFAVCFVGRLIDEKDPLLFSRIASSLLEKRKNIRIQIAGEGMLQDQMKAVFAKKDQLASVDFLGFLNMDGLRDLYARSLCLIHTAPWEGWGMPMIEAMAAGCVTATNSTGCAGEALIDGVNSVVLADASEGNFILSASRLISDASLREKLSKQGIIDAARWDEKILREKMMAFYRESVQRSCKQKS